MPSIGDALGIDYQGAEAHISTPARGGFSHKALVTAFQIPEPSIRPPEPSITGMISKMGSGSPGDNIDVYG